MSDHAPIHYTPQAVAREIEVSVQSVRRWADTYKDLLGDSANPAPGKTRLYIWDDIQILKQIKELRDKGLTPNAITISLSESAKTISTGDIETVTELLPALPDAPESTLGAIVALDAILSLQRQIEALAALPAKIRALEQAKVSDRRLVRDGVFIFMAGVVVAVVIMLIIIVVVDFWTK